jgi:NADH:ubiquinone oxidoreductase subunit 4 (subunit M)
MKKVRDVILVFAAVVAMVVGAIYLISLYRAAVAQDEGEEAQSAYRTCMDLEADPSRVAARRLLKDRCRLRFGITWQE